MKLVGHSSSLGISLDTTTVPYPDSAQTNETVSSNHTTISDTEGAPVQVYSKPRNFQENKDIVNPNHHQEQESMVDPQSRITFDLNLPIVVRKDVRSYTQPVVSNFVSYSSIFPSFRAINLNLSSVNIHRFIQKPLDVPDS